MAEDHDQEQGQVQERGKEAPEVVNNQALVHTPGLAAGEAQSIETLIRVAKAFSVSGMFGLTGPSEVKSAQAFTKIQAGLELGIPPFASMRSINVIDGKAELSASALAGLVKRSAKYDYRVVQSTDAGCSLAFFEAGRQVGVVTFAIEEAKRAGLVKDKSGWQKWPADMCFARAMSRGVRRFCPDLVHGQAIYTEGEVIEGKVIEDELVTPPGVDPVTGEDLRTEDQINDDAWDRAAEAVAVKTVDVEAATMPGPTVDGEPSRLPLDAITPEQMDAIIELCNRKHLSLADVLANAGHLDMALVQLTGQQGRELISALNKMKKGADA